MFVLLQRASKENAKMKEQLERQRLAKEREVLFWGSTLYVCVCVWGGGGGGHVCLYL